MPEPNETLPPVAPPPAKDAMLLLKVTKLKLAEATLAKTTALAFEKAFAAPAMKLPALILVVPEYVLLVPFNCKLPEPIVVNPPVPVSAPLNTAALAGVTLNWLAEPVKPMALDKLIVPRFTCAVLLPALLLKLIAPLVFVKVDNELISKIAVLAAEAVTRILPPLDVPSAPDTVAAKVPALIVVVPV